MSFPIRLRPAAERWPFFYGWFVLAIGAVGVLMSLPGQTIGVSVFIDPLIEALGTSRSHVSFTYMIGTLSSALCLPFMGRLFDRRGAPFMAVLAGAALGLCLVYMGSLDRLAAVLGRIPVALDRNLIVILLLSVGFFFLRLWGQGVLTMVSRTMVMRWFERRRGFANAILGFVTTLGFSLSPRLFDRLINAFSWNGTYYLLAVVVGLVFPVAAFLFYRDNPHDHGLVPDGTGSRPVPEHRTHRTPAADQALPAYTLKEAKRTTLFWLFVATLCISSIIDTAIAFHIISIFENAGMARSAAVRFFFPTYIISIGSHFAGSWLSDHMESKYFSFIHLTGVLVSLVSLVFLSPGLWLWLLILSQGICHGMYGINSTVVWPRYFGTKHLGSINGFAMTWMVLGSALGPFLFSLSLDFASSYTPAALIGSLITVPVLFLMFRNYFLSSR